MIIIDGSEGEGGGQVIRTALSLSAITGKPLEITNIRAKRSNPGLQMQHLTAAKAVRNVCRGTLEGAEQGSSRLVFKPGKIIGGRYDFNIGTAGSVTLVAQTILPILMFADKTSEVSIIGGTHVLKSPGYDYFEHIFVPAIHAMAVQAESKMIKPGYYPKGGGEIRISISPSMPKPVQAWETGGQTKAIIRIANLPLSIAIREKKVLLNNKIEEVYIREDQALSPGNAVTLLNGLRGAYVPGERGKRAEDVSQEAVTELGKETWDVDRHLADQLLLYAALAQGETSFRTSEITEHFKTNAGVIMKFLDRKIQYSDGNVRIL